MAVGGCGWLAILTVGAALAPRPGKGSPPWRLPQVAAQAPLLQGKVFHHFEAVAGEADLAPRGAEHAQLAEAEVGQDLRAGAVAPPLDQRATAGRRGVGGGFGLRLADALQQRLGAVGAGGVEQHEDSAALLR